MDISDLKQLTQVLEKTQEHASQQVNENNSLAERQIIAMDRIANALWALVEVLAEKDNGIQS
jgi:hypothetical protein